MKYLHNVYLKEDSTDLTRVLDKIKSSQIHLSTPADALRHSLISGQKSNKPQRFLKALGNVDVGCFLWIIQTKVVCSHVNV